MVGTMTTIDNVGRPDMDNHVEVNGPIHRSNVDFHAIEEHLSSGWQIR